MTEKLSEQTRKHLATLQERRGLAAQHEAAARTESDNKAYDALTGDKQAEAELREANMAQKSASLDVQNYDAAIKTAESRLAAAIEAERMEDVAIVCRDVKELATSIPAKYKDIDKHLAALSKTLHELLDDQKRGYEFAGRLKALGEDSHYNPRLLNSRSVDLNALLAHHDLLGFFSTGAAHSPHSPVGNAQESLKSITTRMTDLISGVACDEQ